MSFIIFPILVPVAMGMILLLLKNCWDLQKILITLFSVIIISLTLFVPFFGVDEIKQFVAPQSFSETQQLFLFISEALLGIFLLVMSILHKKWLVTLLATVQLGVAVYLEFFLKHVASIATEYDKSIFYFDHLSLLMVLIVGVIGGAVTLYARGYMDEYYRHFPKLKSSSNLFFFLLFLFLGAMVGLVCSNNLLWLHFFWEITTVCSFLLIKYKQDTESINNSFVALAFNLGGGILFSLGIFLFAKETNNLLLDQLVVYGKGGAIALLPIFLLAVAGFTKSAQAPCSSWLLGAMVAPTPVSALLHSSTMVKAGVFLILKLAPALENSMLGTGVATVGAITFLVASILAITKQNAKALLAYSTIANLGLVVLCAGIGSTMAVWAGIAIILFHAISKGLLFLTVGSLEHQLHGKDIELMDGLFSRYPKLSGLLMVGMAGMFLAPFAMLVSKWFVMKAIVDSAPLLIFPLVFGSAATLFYWTKWMGKLCLALGPLKHYENLENKGKGDIPDPEKEISKSEWSALYPLGGLTIISILILPLLSTWLIQPYLSEYYTNVIPIDHMGIMVMVGILVTLLFLPLLGNFFLESNVQTRVVAPYLSGANIKNGYSLDNCFGEVKINLKNYYLTSIINEKKLNIITIVCSIITILFMFYSSTGL